MENKTPIQIYREELLAARNHLINIIMIIPASGETYDGINSMTTLIEELLRK